MRQIDADVLDMAIKALKQEPCEDCISRQAAIDAICKEGTRLERNGTVAMCEIKQWCIDLLERLPSAQPVQWIPCSERLPDKSGTYICNCVESDINHVTFIKWQSRYKRWDLNGRRTFWRVTAWKPIPEPYERRQE